MLVSDSNRCCLPAVHPCCAVLHLSIPPHSASCAQIRLSILRPTVVEQCLLARQLCLISTRIIPLVVMAAGCKLTISRQSCRLRINRMYTPSSTSTEISSLCDTMEQTRKPTLPMFEEEKQKTPDISKLVVPRKLADHCGNNGAYSDAYLEFSEGMTFQKTGDYKRAVQCYNKVGIDIGPSCISRKWTTSFIDEEILRRLLRRGASWTQGEIRLLITFISWSCLGLDSSYTIIFPCFQPYLAHFKDSIVTHKLATTRLLITTKLSNLIYLVNMLLLGTRDNSESLLINVRDHVMVIHQWCTTKY